MFRFGAIPIRKRSLFLSGTYCTLTWRSPSQSNLGWGLRKRIQNIKYLISNHLLTLKSGGAELLFDNKKKHDVELPPGQKWSIRTLLPWIQDNMLKERPELFIQGDTVRPGILVLVNDADWELMGELEYEIQPNDKIVFISTLHGG